MAPAAIDHPNGMIDLIVAPDEKFEGRIFLINDWDGGDADNQLVGEELNRNPRTLELSHVEGQRTCPQFNSTYASNTVEVSGSTIDAFPNAFTNCIIELDFKLLPSTFSKVTFNPAYVGGCIHSGSVSRILLARAFVVNRV